MYNLSFKATFDGLNNEPLKNLFRYRTKNDNEHRLKVILGKNYDDDDKFILYKNNKKTAEYETRINPKSFFIDRLMNIYNLLIQRENLAIEHQKNNQQ